MKRLWVFCDGSTGALSTAGSHGYTGRPSAISDQPSVISRQPSVISDQPSAISDQPSVISDQPSAISHQPSATSCGAGAVALDANGQIVGWDWRPLPMMTNNEAEYAGLLLGLGLAERLGAEETIVLLDSEIVVGQMTGRCAVNSRSLHRWYWQACAAVRGLPAVRFCAIPREWNRLADGLACQAGLPWAWLRNAVDKEMSRQVGREKVAYLDSRL